MNYQNPMSQTPVVNNLLIANVVAYLATMLLDTNDIYALFALFPVGSPFFELWQPVTYMFLHGGFSHLFFNMFALWMFGRGLEMEMGSKRFIIYYFTCGIGAALVQLGMANIDIMNMASQVELWNYMLTPTVGASGAVYGILLAFGMLFPNSQMFVFPIPFPIKAKFFVIGYAVIELFSGLGASGDGIAHFAHLGGMIFGFFLIMYWRKKNHNGQLYF